MYRQAVRTFNSVLTCRELVSRACDLGVHCSSGTGMLNNCLTTSGAVRPSDRYRYAARNCEYVVLHCFNCTDVMCINIQLRTGVLVIYFTTSTIACSQCTGTHCYIVQTFVSQILQCNRTLQKLSTNTQHCPFAVHSCLLGRPIRGRSLKT